MDESKPELKSLLELFNKMEKFSGADLLGKERLGDLAFVGTAEMAERSLALMRELRELPLESLPKKRRDALFAALKKVADVIGRMVNFSSAHPNAQQERNNILTALNDGYDELFGSAAPIIAYYRSSPDLINVFEAGREEALTAIREAKEASTASLLQAQQEAGEILDSMRRAAADVGVSAHAASFTEQASEHLRASKNWLIATVVIALTAILAAAASFYQYFNLAPTLDAARIVQVTAAKVILFSFFYFALIWSARNYRAHRHNYIVSKHRQNALATFQAFVKATTDEVTRNAVLLRATEAIFSLGSSGYVPGEPEPQGGTQILEIFRGGGNS